MANLDPRRAVIGPSGDVEIDSAVIARALGLPLPHFMAEMRNGHVHGLVERGEDEDRGRYRLRVRHRGRELRMAFERDGRQIDETVDAAPPTANIERLRIRLRRELVLQAHAQVPTTYVRLAERVGVGSRNAAEAVGMALGTLMDDDAGMNRPLLAALVVKSVRIGVPAPWFFARARALDLFRGEDGGLEAYAFHAKQLRHAVLHYSVQRTMIAPAVPRSARPASG